MVSSQVIEGPGNRHSATQLVCKCIPGMHGAWHACRVHGQAESTTDDATTRGHAMQEAVRSSGGMITLTRGYANHVTMNRLAGTCVAVVRTGGGGVRTGSVCGGCLVLLGASKARPHQGACTQTMHGLLLGQAAAGRCHAV